MSKLSVALTFATFRSADPATSRQRPRILRNDSPPSTERRLSSSRPRRRSFPLSGGLVADSFFAGTIDADPVVLPPFALFSTGGAHPLADTLEAEDTFLVETALCFTGAQPIRRSSQLALAKYAIPRLAVALKLAAAPARNERGRCQCSKNDLPHLVLPPIPTSAGSDGGVAHRRAARKARPDQLRRPGALREPPRQRVRSATGRRPPQRAAEERLAC